MKVGGRDVSKLHRSAVGTLAGIDDPLRSHRGEGLLLYLLQRRPGLELKDVLFLYVIILYETHRRQYFARIGQYVISMFDPVVLYFIQEGIHNILIIHGYTDASAGFKINYVDFLVHIHPRIRKKIRDLSYLWIFIV